jgi:hypothetical protein
MSDVDCGLAYTAFVTGFLTMTLHSVLIIMEHAERVGNGFSFYAQISNSLLSASVSTLLRVNDGSPEFYRTLFLNAARVDQWLTLVELFEVVNLSERLFDVVGKEWIRVEVGKMKAICRHALQPMDRDLALTLCTALADLIEVMPTCVSNAQKESFSECWISGQEYMQRKLLRRLSDELTYSEMCEIANAFRLMSIKLTEVYELFDGLPTQLVSRAELARSRCSEVVKRLWLRLYDVFEREGEDYLLSSALSWRNGHPTPSLARALAAVTDPLADVKDRLESRLFVNQFLPELVKMIDKKVYTMLGKRIPWNQPGAIEQFVVDLKAMIAVFGPDDFRLLRSARILLTQDESSERIDHELSEDDVEYFVSIKSVM